MSFQKFFNVIHQREIVGDFFKRPIPPLDGEQLFNRLRVETILDDTRRIADGDCIRRNVFGDDSIRADDCTVADFHAAHNRRAFSHPNVVPENNLSVLNTNIGNRAKVGTNFTKNIFNHTANIQR